MKDNFSKLSHGYASYRPAYPSGLYDYLCSCVEHKNIAWDCGTGNGQMAVGLAKHFKQVWATDISRNQLDNAPALSNIIYTTQPAEHSNFENNCIDLITVAQAIHWFDFERFYNEVNRVAKHNAVICAVGYGLIDITPEINRLIYALYMDVLGPHWDEERKYIDERYTTIPFPFKEITPPVFTLSHHWSYEHVMGYLNTWSALKHFMDNNGYNPLDLMANDFKALWGNELLRTITFPMFLRIGRCS